jgi:hypothetical protein
MVLVSSQLAEKAKREAKREIAIRYLKIKMCASRFGQNSAAAMLVDYRIRRFV